jgi:hypothetical protein
MKRFLLSLVASLIAISAFCQSEHLAFKGIPIDGTLQEYIEQLKTVDFRVSEVSNGTAELYGDFAGHKDCEVTVKAILPRNLVNEIEIRFPSAGKWSELYGTYSSLKGMLTKKYGQPTKQTNVYGTSSTTSDDAKFSAVTSGKSNHSCTFETPNGTIHMWITPYYFTAVVRMKYTDKINTATVNSDAYNDL